MKFKEFYNTEKITFKYPTNEGKIEKVLDLNEYKKTIDESSLSKKLKKDLKSRVEKKKEIPIYCENSSKFFMISLLNSKCKELKSRDDKVVCGTIYNAMLNENKKKNETLYNILKEYKLPWDAPSEVYKTS